MTQEPENTGGAAEQEPGLDIQSLGASDTELLNDVMEYLEGHIGALDMIQEAVAEGREQISDEIPRTPAEALDSLTNNLVDKTLEIQAKRAVSNELRDNQHELRL